MGSIGHWERRRRFRACKLHDVRSSNTINAAAQDWNFPIIARDPHVPLQILSSKLKGNEERWRRLATWVPRRKTIQGPQMPSRWTGEEHATHKMPTSTIFPKIKRTLHHGQMFCLCELWNKNSIITGHILRAGLQKLTWAISMSSSTLLLDLKAKHDNHELITCVGPTKETQYLP